MLNAAGDVKGDPEQITHGLDLVDFVFSPDHPRIAFSKTVGASNIWRISLPRPDAPAAAKWSGAQQLTFESSTVSQLELAPDGKRIYFSSRRGGNPDIWSMTVDGGELRQVITTPAEDENIRFSPDGRTLAFRSQRSGKGELWTMPATGGPSKQLTNDPFQKWWHRWSPDGQTLAFVAQDSMNKLDLWIMPVRGGAARQVSTGPADKHAPLWWPDGQSLVSTARTAGATNQLWRFPITGGSPEPLTGPELKGVRLDDLRWSSDKKQIYFLRKSDEATNIWSLSIVDGSVRQLTDFNGRRGEMGRHFATDGTYFYFTWGETTGDIWVMDVEREE